MPKGKDMNEKLIFFAIPLFPISVKREFKKMCADREITIKNALVEAMIEAIQKHNDTQKEIANVRQLV